MPGPDAVSVGPPPNELPANGTDEQLAAQNRQNEAIAAEFLTKIIRMRGVRISRSAYLTQQLRRIDATDATITSAIESTPIQAGISRVTLDRIGVSAIRAETNKSAALSFVTGMPGGFAMFASIPADVTQYYVHTFRVMQELAYLYGWREFLNGQDEVDEEALGQLTMFLGVMMGVSGAQAGLSSFATQVAGPVIQDQISKRVISKTAWRTPMKRVLRQVGIRVTRASLARSVTKVVPVVSGAVAGGMTFVSLRGQGERLRIHLREMPPPGLDAAEFRALVENEGN